MSTAPRPPDDDGQRRRLRRHATERFSADKSPFEAVKDTPKERGRRAGPRVPRPPSTTTIRRHKVTYDEYNALKAWLIHVGRDGEWPLFLDVWVEHVVEEVANRSPRGQQGHHRGPVLRPRLTRMRGARGAMPMREDEDGTPLVWKGQITVDRRHPARRRQGRALARRRRRLLLAVRPRPPGVEPARHVHRRRERRVRDHHRRSPRPTRSRPTAPAAS